MIRNSIRVNSIVTFVILCILSLSIKILCDSHKNVIGCDFGEENDDIYEVKQC